MSSTAEEETAAATAAAGGATATDGAEDDIISTNENLKLLIMDIETQLVQTHDDNNQLQNSLKAKDSKINELQNLLKNKDEEIRSKELIILEETKEKQVSKDQLILKEESYKSSEERYDRIKKENDNLLEEISNLTKKTVEQKEQIVQLEANATLSSSDVLPLTYEKNRLEKELDTLQKHNEWLESSLRETQNSTQQEKESYSKEKIELRSQINNLTYEKDEALIEMSNVEKQNSTLQTKLDDKIEKNKELTITLNEQKENYDLQLLEEKKYIDLQKEQIVRTENRCNDLIRQLDVLQETAKAAQDEYSKELEYNRNQILEQTQRTIQQQASDHQIVVQELQRKLDDANKQRMDIEDTLLSSPSRGGSGIVGRIGGSGLGGSGLGIGGGIGSPQQLAITAGGGGSGIGAEEQKQGGGDEEGLMGTEGDDNH